MPPVSAAVSSVRRARDLRAFMRMSVDRDEAFAKFRAAVEQRGRRFVDSVAASVYANPASPYLPLLRAADCTLADLEESVGGRGVEATLELLRESGVYVTADEWKGRTPLVRPGVELRVGPSDFNRPAADTGLGGSSSGSSGGPRVRTPVGFAGLTEWAESLLILGEAYGLVDPSVALWLPAPPGGGLATALGWAKVGHPPLRWFSQTPAGGPLSDRLAARFLRAGALTLGRRLPSAELTELGEAAKVAAWLGAARKPAVLQAFTSSAVRVARAALERSIDVSGTFAMVGGEPVTDERIAVLAEAGIRVVPTYGATEAGVIANGCAVNTAAEDYHLALDRIALLTGPATDDGTATLWLTSLAPTAGKVLINVDIGDEAVVERRSCGCLFGELGLDAHLTRVRSRAKRTSEGMTVPTRQLWDVVGQRLAPLGGTRDDFQIWETNGDGGISSVTLVVDPKLAIDEARLRSEILDALGAQSAGAKLAAEVWRQAGTLRIARERPKLSGGGKLLPVLAEPSV